MKGFLMKKVLKNIGKVTVCVLLAIVGLAAIILGGLNIAKFAIYPDYYAIKESVCKNPGLNDGFVCQGIAISEGNAMIFVSGYMKDHSASRLYITDLDSNSYYVSLLKENGDDFTGHAGGVATTADKIYLASNNKIHIISLKDVLDAKNGDKIQISDSIEINNEASFVYTDEEYLYVGEFHDGVNYVTGHPYETAEGMHYAIISRYKIDDLSKPDKIYSVRNKVQGACFTPDGKVFLSTSYGLTDSVYYVYDEGEATNSGLTLDGAPVYYLDKCEKEIKAPAMAEDVDYYNGRIITLTESASDKYIFGKFFFANKIVSLEY